MCDVSLQISLSEDELVALAALVAPFLETDEGFLNVPNAAAYLDTTPKAIYALVERQRIPHQRAGGRLLFDRRELRRWVEADG